MHEWLETINEIVLSEDFNRLLSVVLQHMDKSCILAEMSVTDKPFRA